MKYRDKIGTRFLAAVAIVPAFVFFSLFLEGGSRWWILAALVYPCAALAIVLFSPWSRDEDPKG